MNDFAQLIRSLTDDEIKAKLPEQAARFFTQHPPLLQAWRVKFENPQRARELEYNYLMTLRPDEQYGIVFEISEIHRAVGALHAAFTVVKQHQDSSKWDDMRRYSRYGVNVHLPSEDFTLLIRALVDQQTLARTQMQTTTDRVVIDSLVQEAKLSREVYERLLEQLSKTYPELVRSIKGNA